MLQPKGQEEGLDAYSLFIFVVKSPLTRKKYTGRLWRFFDFVGLDEGTVQERCNTFADMARKDSKWALNNIIRFLQAQKQKGRA